MRTATIERATLTRRIDTVGQVMADERRLYAVEARTSGWVEALQVRAESEFVRRGQLVAAIYAPELLAAQEEMLVTLDVGRPSLVSAARDRLLLLGVSETQVEKLVRTREASRRVDVYAPAEGFVTDLDVREGAQVTPGAPLFRIADLSKVWITAEVPESQADWVRAGQSVEVRLPAAPGRMFEGRVEFVYPELAAQTRTLRARAVIDNPELTLKPGMYANASILVDPQRDVLVAPQAAVIRTGRRTVVIVAESEGRFRPVEVEIGAESDGRIVVLSGLQAGQQVVTSGQFLIDSEASLLGAYDRLGGDPPAGRIRDVGGTGHGAAENSPSVNQRSAPELTP
jgi:Cu(I)/Ag(I) efflux system membrane fusion protein